MFRVRVVCLGFPLLVGGGFAGFGLRVEGRGLRIRVSGLGFIMGVWDFGLGFLFPPAVRGAFGVRGQVGGWPHTRYVLGLVRARR